MNFLLIVDRCKEHCSTVLQYMDTYIVPGPQMRAAIWWGAQQSVLVFLCLWGFVFAAENSYNRLAPTTNWVFNVSVESVDPIHVVLSATQTGGMERNNIDMQSVREVYLPVEIQHHDILYCKIDGVNWRFISQQILTVSYTEMTYSGYETLPDDAPEDVYQKSGQWEYSGKFPKISHLPTTCRITANMKWSPSPFVTKRTHKKTAPFELVLSADTIKKRYQ